MAKAKRVFELAKELGVKSKAIVDKCIAEGVPGITNHMSTVKVGLAMTIRQWFGEAEETGGATAIETAEKVDLKKARKRGRGKSQQEAGGEGQEAGTTVTTLEAPVEEMAGTGVADVEVEDEGREDAVVESTEQPAVEPAAQSSVEAEGETVAEAALTTDEVAEPVEADAPDTTGIGEVGKAVKPVGRMNVPKRPEVVKPAGKQLEKPKQARLKGPKVVRIDKPEPPRPPRTRRGPSSGPLTAPLDVSRTTPSDTGRGKRGRGGPGETDEGAGRPGKRRMLNTRRGRSADALPVGPTKFSQADMEELDARLKGATGYLKQRRRDMRKREQSTQTAQSLAVTGGKVEIQEPVTIKALSSATGIKSVDIIKYLFKQGIMATINSAISTEAAVEIAMEYNIELEVRERQTAEQQIQEQFNAREPVDVRPRPPVVTVLGHVDHGKTSLLDKIRQANVVAHEAGGITQHVGAYRVTVMGSDDKEKTVVFLDTPGHEAFTSMRARGAGLTDLVVLVIAADDGVMPQTVESINHAKAAGVPIIVALNKIDLPQATAENVHKIYGQLAEHGLNPVDWGGDTEVVRTSATEGRGITDLMEVLDYQAELLELKADYGGPARGVVIESEMQPGRGPVARVLVQEGRIKVGDFIVIGRAFGRVRDMTDDQNKTILEAGPATPLELSGIDEIPDAGDKFYITDTLRRAEGVSSQHRERERQEQLANKAKVTLDNFADQIKAGQMKELRVVLKADVQGSVDVLCASLERLGNDEVGVRVLHSAVGGITESDVLLADASDAVIVGFHVTVPPAVREIAEARSVDVRLYRVIYDVTNEVKDALEGMLEPETKEADIGRAEVREVFRVTKVGLVAGCLVTEGMIQRNAKVRVIREGIVVTDNREIVSLRRVKEDVGQVRAGTECGIRIQGYDDVKAGDIIHCYKIVEVKRTLS